jgi:hypothetical protein
MRWVVLIACLPALAYGLVNLASSRTTIAWQLRATERRDGADPRKHIGTAFQSWVGVDRNEPPSAAARRKVQLIGVGEIAVSLVVILGAFVALS